MRLSLSSSLALSWAVVSLAACKEPEGLTPKMAELAPEGAKIAAGFSLAPIQTSAIADMLGAAATSDRDVSAMITAVGACDIDTTNLHGSMVAPLSDTADDVFIIIESPGIGNKDALECMEKESAKALGDDPGNLMLKNHGPVRVAPMEGGGSMIQFNENAIGVVDGTWEEEILGRVEKAEARTKTEMTAALEAANPDADVWIAVVADDDVRSGLAELAPADSLEFITASVDIDEDWTLAAGMHFGDTDKAKAFEGALSAVKDELTAGAAASGVPETTMKTLKFELADKDLSISLKIPKADVTSLATMAGAAMVQ